MCHRSAIWAVAAAAALLTTTAFAQANDQPGYPDLSGQWTRMPIPGIVGNPSFDPTKPAGRGQQAPLTPEYQAIFDANLEELASGGGGDNRSWVCMTPGMPMVMQVYEPMEIVITPDTTHIMIQANGVHRRIYTDGRDWPEFVEPAFLGYSIGKWIDEDRDGRYDVLEVETRYMKGPRVLDATGIPLHRDNQSVVKERIYVDNANHNVLHDEITLHDHALTRAWTVLKNYQRNPSRRPVWYEFECTENNPHILIGKEAYMLSSDGLLMPGKKDQPPPDLRYFKKSQK
jgi:hypothetical protein